MYRRAPAQVRAWPHLLTLTRTLAISSIFVNGLIPINSINCIPLVRDNEYARIAGPVLVATGTKGPRVYEFAFVRAVEKRAVAGRRGGQGGKRADERPCAFRVTS